MLKRILTLSFLLLNSLNLALGRQQHNPIWEKVRVQADLLKQHRVKAQRKYVSLPGLVKMRPYQLEKETCVDTLGRIVKHTAFKYSTSLFDNHSYMTNEKFEYNARDFLIAYLQDYVVERQNYNDYSTKVTEIWYGYDSLGWFKFVYYIHPSRVVRQISDTIRVQNPHINRVLNLFVFPGAGIGLVDPSTNPGLVDPSTNEHVNQVVDGKGTFKIERSVVLNSAKQVSQIVQASAYPGSVTITNFKYNPEGLLSEKEVVDENGRRLSKALINYHSNGLVYKISILDKKDKPVRIERYDYEYY